MVNEVTLIGNVGSDPEVKFFDSGSQVAKFTLATSEKYKSKTGEKQEKTQWHNVVAWSGLAKLVESYVKKGSKLYIRGRLEYEQWEDKKTGEKKSKTNIVVDDLKFLGGPKEKAEARQEEKPQTQQDDSLPF